MCGESVQIAMNEKRSHYSTLTFLIFSFVCARAPQRNKTCVRARKEGVRVRKSKSARAGACVCDKMRLGARVCNRVCACSGSVSSEYVRVH